MRIKFIKELNPNDKTIKEINSTNPEKIEIVNGKVSLIEPTNIETIIPVKYLLFYRTKIIEFYEYPEEHIKGNNFINYKTKETFNRKELRNYILNY